MPAQHRECKDPRDGETSDKRTWEQYAQHVCVTLTVTVDLKKNFFWFLLTTCYVLVLIMTKLYFIRFPSLFRHAVSKANKMNFMVLCLQNLELSVIKYLTELLN